MDFTLKITLKFLFICALIIFSINTINAIYWMPYWVNSIVEEVAQEFKVNTPYIFQEMRSVRQFNSRVTPTCTDIRLNFGNLIIGDRLIEKLEVTELKLLMRRAFVYSKNRYLLKKASLIAAILVSNAYLFKKPQDDPLFGAGIFLLDVIAYLGLNIYCEKQIDQEIIKDEHDQEILDNAYKKISPNGWPLNKWPSFYKNFARYIGF